MGTPDWVIVAVAVVITVGLPIVLCVAWFFEITPGGFVPTHEVRVGESLTPQTGRRINRVIIVLLATALAFFVGDYLYRTATKIEGSATNNIPLSLAVVPRGSASDTLSLTYQLASEVRRVLEQATGLPITPRDLVESLVVTEPPEAAASELGVRYLLLFDASTNGVEDVIAVSLYDFQINNSVWTATFSPNSDDALEFQQLVARQVAQRLGVASAAEADKLFELPTKNSESYALYLRGIQELNLSRYESRAKGSDAEKYFVEALKLDSKFALPLAGLCRISLARYSSSGAVKSFEQAERYCHRALTLGRSSGEVHISLGSLYIASGQYARAEEAFREALSVNPSYISALLGLAKALSKQSKFKEAEQIYLRAIRAQPGYYLPYDSIADFYFTARRDYVKSRENLVIASRLAPNDPAVLSDLATTYMLQGDFVNSIRLLEQSLILSPDNYSSKLNLGTVYFFQGRYADAKQLYEQGVEKYPEDGTAWRNLGDALYTLDDRTKSDEVFRQAIALLERQLSINQTDSKILGSLAVSLGSVGESGKLDLVINQVEKTEKFYPGTDYDLAVALCRFQESLRFNERAASLDLDDRSPYIFEDEQHIDLLFTDIILPIHPDRARSLIELEILFTCLCLNGNSQCITHTGGSVCLFASFLVNIGIS